MAYGESNQLTATMQTWAKTANGLTNRLKRDTASLKQHGIIFEPPDPKDRLRRYRARIDEPLAVLDYSNPMTGQPFGDNGKPMVGNLVSYTNQLTGQPCIASGYVGGY
jgi:hypothetical protein